MKMAAHAADCLANPTAEQMLDVVHSCLHNQTSEWIFLRELRVGTGFRNRAAQRLDAFALNCLSHTAMKRVCYEVKTSRADFLCELKNPVKRRIGFRYSNEFFFVTPVALLEISEVPIECGLIEIGVFRDQPLPSVDTLPHFSQAEKTFCRVTVPAPWRETPGPTWQFLAGMLRNQQRALSSFTQTPPRQQRFTFLD